MLVGSARTSTLELQSGPWNKPGQLNHAPPLLRGSVFGSRRLNRPAPPSAGVFVLRRGLMMFMTSPAPMRRVLAPDGTVLTLANLPSPDAQRSVASRKAIVVAAVRGGLLSMSDVSVTRDMSGFGSTRSVRFLPEGSHAAGGQNGPDHRCDWASSSEEVELRGGGGAVGHERTALSPAARRL